MAATAEVEAVAAVAGVHVDAGAAAVVVANQRVQLRDVRYGHT